MAPTLPAGPLAISRAIGVEVEGTAVAIPARDQVIIIFAGVTADCLVLVEDAAIDVEVGPRVVEDGVPITVAAVHIGSGRARLGTGRADGFIRALDTLLDI
jgi:hypothetical protein